MNKTSWYSKHKQRTLENVKKWARANREKSNSYKRKWFLENPNYKKEWKRKNQSMRKVTKWLEDNGYSIIRGKNNGFCTNCGMRTLPTELFKYNNTFHCVDCLLDIIKGDIKVNKLVCTNCKREHRDSTHYGLCIDCFVSLRRTALQKMLD